MSGVQNGPPSLQEFFVDTTRDILGDSTALLIQQCFSATRFENAEAVHTKLVALFGDGAKVLERIIIKELSGALVFPYEKKEPFDFQQQYSLLVKVYEQGRKVT